MSDDAKERELRKKVSKYVVFSGPYFPVFGPEKTPFLDTFHAVEGILKNDFIQKHQDLGLVLVVMDGINRSNVTEIVIGTTQNYSLRL